MTDKEKLYDILMSNIEYRTEELLEIIPEIKPMIGFDHKHPHHHLDVWNHTLLALSLSEEDFDIRLALLLHDIGKPHSYQEGEVRHFENHPLVSRDISKIVLERLDYPKDYIEKILYLIKNHDSPISKEIIKKDFSLAEKLYKVQECDALAHHPEKLEKRKRYLVKVKELLNNKN